MRTWEEIKVQIASIRVVIVVVMVMLKGGLNRSLQA